MAAPSGMGNGRWRRARLVCSAHRRGWFKYTALRSITLPALHIVKVASHVCCVNAGLKPKVC
jgi:hypothetical protein